MATAPTSRCRVAALAHALESLPDFDSPPASPVALDAYGAPGDRAVEAVVERYWSAGFAVIECAEEPTPQRLLGLAEAFGLGEAFVPPLYRCDRHGTGVATLTVPDEPAGADRHPAFESSGARALHVDGTLQPIGFIKTSLLLCQAPAAAGGQTVLFNALRAFAELAGRDPEAADALIMPGCLVRGASYGGGVNQVAGPAFAVRDELLVTRYSVDSLDRWEAPDGVDSGPIARAAAFMDQASRPGVRHRLEFLLEAGQGLVLANDRTAHGRTAYHDGGQTPRRLYRALFRRRPS